jgi:hypothetical protein
MNFTVIWLNNLKLLCERKAIFIIYSIHFYVHFAAPCSLPHRWLAPNYVTVPETDKSDQIRVTWL